MAPRLMFAAAGTSPFSELECAARTWSFALLILGAVALYRGLRSSPLPSSDNRHFPSARTVSLGVRIVDPPRPHRHQLLNNSSQAGAWRSVTRLDCEAIQGCRH